MFYSVDEILEDFSAFEGVKFSAQFSDEVLQRLLKFDYVCLYSDRYLARLPKGRTDTDLKLRLHEFLFKAGDNVLVKKRDRDPDPNKRFSVYKYWGGKENYTKMNISLEFFFATDSGQEVTSRLNIESEGMSFCIVNNEEKVVHYMERRSN